MSGDCCPIDTSTPHEAPSKPLVDESYPMPSTVSRTILGISTYASVVTSPATWTRPVVTIVSTATRLPGSWASMASRIESEIWSQILSGWPSVTDSDVNRRADTQISSGAANADDAEQVRRQGVAARPREST